MNSIILVNELARKKFDGPFTFRRDGGQWEADLDDLDITKLEGFDDATAIALADDDIVAHGTVTVIEHIPEEGTLGIAVDDPHWASPADLPDDFSVEA